MATVGLAVFVKTPGLSPIKTRLAASSDAAQAAQFYNLSCRAVHAMVRQASRCTIAGEQPGVQAYWAVAEADGAAHWPDLPVLQQGEGGLGERLARVYDTLQQRHPIAMLIGADCPQMPSEDILAAVAAHARGARYVLGPARDGGFYLFSGIEPIPTSVWLEVPYSAANTAAAFAASLSAWSLSSLPLNSLSVSSLPVSSLRSSVPYANSVVAMLPTQRGDVDTAADLFSLTQELLLLSQLSQTQSELLQWLKENGYG